jgi:hypothetical protein
MRRTVLAMFCAVGIALAADDPTLALARRAASEYGATLPNYFCQETMERYNVVSNSLRTLPRQLDTVQAEVVYEQGKETFRNLRVNGKPVERADGGIWAVGVFGPLMASLFEPRLEAEFHLRGEAREAGRAAVRYDFSVAEARSNWVISVAQGQVQPAYHGSIWVEAATGRILRHELETSSLPDAFQYQAASLSVRYRFVTINGTEYLLPRTTESRLCPRNYFYCDRVEATYTGCRKFSAESSLKFDGE